uniref:NMDA receptor synaptonuclear signaling and neuronal migration factor b n=1 Tax=Xiphophorus couchianus TaxID=32473 RepID=A0A3B5M8G3_9TELE
MGTAVSKRKNLRSDAISSVAAKVRIKSAQCSSTQLNTKRNDSSLEHRRVKNGKELTNTQRPVALSVRAVCRPHPQRHLRPAACRPSACCLVSRLFACGRVRKETAALLLCVVCRLVPPRLCWINQVTGATLLKGLPLSLSVCVCVCCSLNSPFVPVCESGGELQTSSGTLDEGLDEDADWEQERGLERAACEGDYFIPPKIMLISSKVPKAEYVPDIIRRDDPSIIPILYDHEHATFDDILEEIEKKLTAYRKGCRIWNMLIFCQGGPGHLYLLKNKVATFAKVEKEDDMVQFWRRLSRLMSKLNPEPNLIHIMGCYVLGSANGEKLIQTLKRLMRPLSVEFKSPLELSAQGKEMIEMYFDFRLYRLWKSRQHSKLLDYDDLL